MASKTDPIPAWSTNLSVNVPKDERELLGRLAASEGCRSLAQFVKGLIALGVAQKCQASAAELREIRRRYYGSILLLTFLGALAASWADHNSLERGCRRCARRAGWRFEECVTVEVEEI
jgi:hypothetical protein